MCLPAVGAGFASIAGLAISAVSTVAGIVQNQQAAAAQAAQARQSAALAQRQQQEQANYAFSKAQRDAQYQRQVQMMNYRNQQMQYAAAQDSYKKQIDANNRAANTVYQIEQMKLKEASDKAAFKSQEIYAKQIGDAGRILAAGQSGQSIGSLVRDTETQSGFALTQQDATVRSAAQQANLQMQAAGEQNESANNRAFSSLPLAPVEPIPIPDPIAPPGATIGIRTR